MYISRVAENIISKYLHKPEILAIVGPRQCGKTTTINQLTKTLEKSVFLTFEDREILSLFENNLPRFIETYVTPHDYLIIDEFQYSKNGGQHLKFIYDTEQIKIIVTGSSVIDLTINTIKYLVGRIFVVDMAPFNYFEYLSFHDPIYAELYTKYRYILLDSGEAMNLAVEQINKFQHYYESFITWGGYPRVVTADDDEERKEVLKNIYNTYLLRDVRDNMGLIDDYKFAKLLKALALQISNLIAYEELCSTSGFSYPTLKNNLNFLSKTYICQNVPPFYKNKRKEIIKNPKVFFFDTGLRNYIINDFRYLDQRSDAGALLENAVWTELNKQNLPVNYWRDKNQNEIDFIITGEANQLYALEIKIKQNKCTHLPLAYTKDYPASINKCGYLEGVAPQTDQVFLPLL